MRCLSLRDSLAEDLYHFASDLRKGFLSRAFINFLVLSTIFPFSLMPYFRLKLYLFISKCAGSTLAYLGLPAYLGLNLKPISFPKNNFKNSLKLYIKRFFGNDADGQNCRFVEGIFLVIR